jgi:hypothetical protein
MSMTGNLLPFTAHTEIALVDHVPESEGISKCTLVNRRGVIVW